MPTRRDPQKLKARLAKLTDALLRGDKAALRQLATALGLRRAEMGLRRKQARRTRVGRPK